VIVVDDDVHPAALRRQLQVGFSVLDFESAEEFLTGEVPTEDARLCLTFIHARNPVLNCAGLIAAGRAADDPISGRDEVTRQMMRK
jgi:hypothetical protein